MSYLRSRSQLLARVRRDLHEANIADARILDHLQDATEEIWDDLTAIVDGPGRVREERTIAALDPDGYVPGNALPLPVRWLRFVPRTIRQNGARLKPGRPDRDDIEVPGRYWIDGPTQDPGVGGQLVAASAVLLTSSAWVAGDVLEWLYVQQAPLWRDPTDATIDVLVDLATPSIEAALSRYTAARVVARGDDVALGRARSELGVAIERYNRSKQSLAPRPRRVRDYQAAGRRRR